MTHAWNQSHRQAVKGSAAKVFLPILLFQNGKKKFCCPLNEWLPVLAPGVKRGVAGGSRAGGLVGLGADTMRKAKGKKMLSIKKNRRMPVLSFLLCFSSQSPCTMMQRSGIMVLALQRGRLMISVATRSVHDAATPSPICPSMPLTLAPCGVLSAAQEPRAP
ncbi:hypothetical protein BS614_30795 (plasmid) [Paenibacillus xylanexedens]|nr:hypothetical protein BS614_30795 [Paenibacillus xylanexedens]